MDERHLLGASNAHHSHAPSQRDPSTALPLQDVTPSTRGKLAQAASSCTGAKEDEDPQKSADGSPVQGRALGHDARTGRPRGAAIGRRFPQVPLHQPHPPPFLMHQRQYLGTSAVVLSKAATPQECSLPWSWPWMQCMGICMPAEAQLSSLSSCCMPMYMLCLQFAQCSVAIPACMP